MENGTPVLLASKTGSQEAIAVGTPMTQEWGCAQAFCDVMEAPREKQPQLSKSH